MWYAALRTRREHAAQLAIGLNASRGDPKAVKKLIEEAQK